MIILAPLAAFAETEHTVLQKGKKFSPAELNIKVGNTVTFENNDKTRHNVYSKSSGQKFKIRKQKPGARDSVSFDSVGAAEARCAIHPKMKMVINISN